MNLRQRIHRAITSYFAQIAASRRRRATQLAEQIYAQQQERQHQQRQPISQQSNRQAVNRALSLYRFPMTILLVLGLMGLFLADTAYAQDKSGVKPQVISLPTGPGSLEGLGESFEPNLSTGTSSYPVKFTAPPGRVGFQPELSLNYNGGNDNDPWGMGWELSIPSIQRRTDDGIPSYDDEQDTFIYSNGEKLVRLTNGDYRFENESSFMRFRRLPSDSSGADNTRGWEAHTPDGIRYIFGATENARVDNHRGVFRWELERVIDTHGNDQQYIYLHDGEFAYPREIRYSMSASSGATNYNAVIFNYEPRPDTFVDRRSGSPIRVGLRGTNIEMWSLGELVRAYQFTYEPERSTGTYSLLTSVTQVGDDGTSTLPPHTFTYTQFDPTAYQVVPMQNPPPVPLTNVNVELSDSNGDGLPDIMDTTQPGQHRFYLNRGKGRWDAQPILPQNSPAEQLADPNVLFADVNGDGRGDLLVKAGNTPGSPFYYYANHAGNNNTSGQWNREDRVNFGSAPALALNAPNVQLNDFDNDGSIDFGATVGNRLKIWLAQEDGLWSEEADVDVAVPEAGDSANFEDPRLKIIGMDGDGINDLVLVRDGRVIVWAHNGNGDYDAGQPLLNPPTDVVSDDSQIQVAELNGDGLGDLLVVSNRSVTYWLNLGDGSLSEPITLQNTPAYNANDTALRIADMDGDGKDDLLFSSPSGMSYVDFSTGPQPFLLKSVDNGLGRTIHITYKSSIEDYVADWDANNPWEINLPFPVQVVNRVVVHDANSGDDYTIDYHYRDGYYDGIQKEFRGFVRSQEIKVGDETAATTITNLLYDVGMTDESRKGMVLESEVIGEGGECNGNYTGCYVRMVNQITTRVVVGNQQTRSGDLIAYSYVSQSDTSIHEQQATPIQLRETFEQDEYGNQTKMFDYGQVCGEDVTCGDDELLTNTEYIYDQDRYIFNRVMRVRQTDASSNLLTESRMYYDGDPFVGLPLGELTRGDLTRQTDLQDVDSGHFIPTKRHQYDQYGNAVAIMDANGNRTTVEYDPQIHTFPVVERLHFADGKVLTYAAAYHTGFGKVTNATDYNGHAHTYTYDTFGRLSSIVHPGDTVAQPTQRFRYEIGSPRSAIFSEYRERSGEDEFYTTVTYFDGLGRKLQVRSEAEDSQVMVTEATLFNARQSARDEFLPYYDTGMAYRAPDPALPHVTQIYDPMSRAVRRNHPDGTFTRVDYQPLVQVLYDEENTNPASPYHNMPRTLTFDGQERLVTVEELNQVHNQLQRYTTRYSYDYLGNLTEIVDTEGNVKRQFFDALSRKIAIDDPDRGRADFTHDDNGNVIESVDAKGQRLHFAYDAANRIVALNLVTGADDRTPEMRYHYDADLSTDYPDATNTQGRLAWVEDESGAEYLSYDDRGNMTGRIKRVIVPESNDRIDFAMRMEYDTMQRMVAYSYPDGVVQQFRYNEQSFVDAIPGFVNNIDYIALGKRSRITTADGATTHYGYDARQRMETLRTVGQDGTIYQDWRYQLNGLSSIERIDDLRPNKTAADDDTRTFRYDALQRLTRVQYASGDHIAYEYDPIGNLMGKVSSLPEADLNTFNHGGAAGPHAVTQVHGKAWTYDANGNLATKPGFTFTWDQRNRLTEIHGENGLRQVNTYDYSDRRIAKRVINGATNQLSLYPDRSFEVRDGKMIKYLFANDQRVAKVTTPFDRTLLIKGFHGDDSRQDDPAVAEIRFYHGDHLGSASVLVDATGALVERRAYHPFGGERATSGTDATDYSFTGKEFDAEVGLYYFGARYYDPTIGHFISPDPLYFENAEKDLLDPQALNLYSYVRNNPLRNVDPDGRDVVIAYGTGHNGHLHRGVANRLARELRQNNIRVHVIKATSLNKAKTRRKLARRNISAAVFVGHGNVDTIGYKARKRGGRVRWVRGQASNPERFARQAGVERGGVVGFLSCSVVDGDTNSERALNQRGITTVGFDRKVFLKYERQGRRRSYTVRSPDPHISLDDIGALPTVKDTPWVTPSDIEPNITSGPNENAGESLGEHIQAAEERVND